MKSTKKRYNSNRKAKWLVYDAEKNRLAKLGLPAKEYEEKITALAKKLGI